VLYGTRSAPIAPIVRKALALHQTWPAALFPQCGNKLMVLD
jgi:hypothetical protein